MKPYHLLFLLISSAFNITNILCQDESYSIKELLSQCTQTVKEMNLSDDDVQMSKEDAKKMAERIGEISKISSIPNKSERKAQWKSHKKLGVLKAQMKSLEETFKLPPDERRKVLQANKGMQKTVVKLSKLDPKNKSSPLKGKNVKKYMNKGGKSVQSSWKKGELKVKLLFKKLIPPSRSS